MLIFFPNLWGGDRGWWQGQRAICGENFVNKGNINIENKYLSLQLLKSTKICNFSDEKYDLYLSIHQGIKVFLDS